MENNNIKKYIIIFLVLIIIFSSFYFFIFKKSSKSVTPSVSIVSTKIEVEKNIAIFPKDIVQEESPIVIDSYQAKTDKGVIQNTYVYQSLYDMKKNADLYKLYLTNNGWKPITIDVQNGITSMYSAKGNQNLSIMITAISTTTQSTVDISLVTTPVNN